MKLCPSMKNQQSYPPVQQFHWWSGWLRFDHLLFLHHGLTEDLESSSKYDWTTKYVKKTFLTSFYWIVSQLKHDKQHWLFFVSINRPLCEQNDISVMIIFKKKLSNSLFEIKLSLLCNQFFRLPRVRILCASTKLQKFILHFFQAQLIRS